MLSGRTPSILVNSHWHPSHTFGNATFGSCAIFGTETTRGRINELGPVWVATVEDPDWGNRTAALQNRHDTEPDPLRRREIAAELSGRRELRESRDRVRVRPRTRSSRSATSSTDTAASRSSRGAATARATRSCS